MEETLQFFIDFFSSNIKNVINVVFPNEVLNKEIHIMRFIFIFYIINYDKQEQDKEDIFQYLLNGTKITKNYANKNPLYLILISMIEANENKRNNNFLKKFDYALTSNIKRFKTRDPTESPIIGELLDVFFPLMEQCGIYEILIEEINSRLEKF